MPTVLVADPHPAMAAAIVDLLRDDVDTDVVPLATTRANAARLLARYRPDVLLLEPSILGADGLAALPLLQQASPLTRIVLMGMDDPARWEPEVERSCAVAYISKWAPVRDWRPTVLAAAKGSLAQAS